jgi:hypothetical protein
MKKATRTAAEKAFDFISRKRTPHFDSAALKAYKVLALARLCHSEGCVNTDSSVKPRRLRRKNVTAKYLKEQEPVLWGIMYGSTVLELEMQKAIINSNKKNSCQYVGYLPKLFIENIAHNVACKAVHEHLKRTRK